MDRVDPNHENTLEDERLEPTGPKPIWKRKSHHIPYHPWDWYIYLHENHKNQP